MEMYGPRQEPRTLPWAKYQIFLETLFIGNDIDKNLNKKFHSYLSYHSFKLLFLFLNFCLKYITLIVENICALSCSWKACSFTGISVFFFFFFLLFPTRNIVKTGVWFLSIISIVYQTNYTDAESEIENIFNSCL